MVANPTSSSSHIRKPATGGQASGVGIAFATHFSVPQLKKSKLPECSAPDIITFPLPPTMWVWMHVWTRYAWYVLAAKDTTSLYCTLDKGVPISPSRLTSLFKVGRVHCLFFVPSSKLKKKSCQLSCRAGQTCFPSRPGTSLHMIVLAGVGLDLSTMQLHGQWATRLMVSATVVPGRVIPRKKCMQL